MRFLALRPPELIPAVAFSDKVLIAAAKLYLVLPIIKDAQSVGLSTKLRTLPATRKTANFYLLSPRSIIKRNLVRNLN